MEKNIFFVCCWLLNSFLSYANEHNHSITDSATIKSTAGGYYKMADSLSKAQLFYQAIDYFIKAKELYITLGDWEKEVLCINNIGWNYLESGNLTDAELILHDALNKSITTGGTEHFLVAQNYNTLGILNVEKGDLEKSHAFHQKALSIRLKIFGENNIEVAKSYANGGVVFRRTADYQMAISYYEHALKIVKNLMGEQNMFAAGIYSNLGNIFVEYFDNDKAINYHSNALQIWIQLTDSTHPMVGKCLNNFGIALNEKCKETTLSKEQQQHYKVKASNILKKSLEINEEKLGSNHPEVATTFMNLSLVNTDDYDSSMFYLNRAKIIYLHNYQENHQFVGKLYQNVAILNLKHYKFQESIQYLQKSFYCFVNDFEKEKPDHIYSTLQNPGLSSIKSPMFLLDALLTKAEVLYTKWKYEK